jgi:hypothetical protein
MSTQRPSFDLREVVVESGRSRSYDEAEWRDTLVVVQRGEIELECLSGSRFRFGDGAVLWLAGLPLRALNNHGLEPALLLAVSRDRWRDEFRAARPSDLT